jgi:hypothetical protein
MTNPAEQIRCLLTDAADGMPGGPVIVPDVFSGRTGRMMAEPRRRRTVVLAAAFTLVAVAIAVPIAVLRLGQPTAVPLPGYSISTVDSYPTSGPATADEIAKDTWSRMPDAPIPGRAAPVTVWTGREMLVWGGFQGQQARADGAAYDPRTRQWRVLPAAPISGRSEAATVWTGTRLFIWGGNNSDFLSDGATYDPATDRWHLLPPSPLQPLTDAVAVWDGTEVILMGVAEHGLNQTAAAYDPSTDAWRAFPPIPQEADQPPFKITAVALPDGIHAWVYWSDGTGSLDGHEITINSGVAEYRYDPAAGAWRAVSTSAPDDLGTPLWTGREVVFPATQPLRGHPGPLVSNLAGWRLDPTGGSLVRIAHGPVDDLRAASVWTGGALLSANSLATVSGAGGVVSGPGEAAVWDPRSDAWTRLPRAPYAGYLGVTPVWTGQELLEWGLMYAVKDDPAAATTVGLRLGPG